MEQDYIDGNPEMKALILFNYIYIDNIEFKEEQSISMTYNKDFKEQFLKF